MRKRKLERNFVMGLALCLPLLSSISLVYGGDKNGNDKEKDHASKPVKQSRQVSKSDNNGRGNGSNQNNNGSNQSSHANNAKSTTNSYNPSTSKSYNPNSNTEAYHPAKGAGTDSRPAIRPDQGRGPEVAKGGHFDDRDRGRNDFHPAPGGNHAFREPVRTERQFGSSRVAFDRGGHVRDIHARDMEIHRGLRGERTFVAERHGVRIVGAGGHLGYVEHPYANYHGRAYVQRTYVVGGVTYVHAYRTFTWHGAVYYHYAPVSYYHPGFYAWAYNPWPRPAYYHWGWRADPWYPAYGYYFAPYPVYPTAAFWLTDYLLAENLRLAYANGQYSVQAAAAQQSQQYDLAPQNYPQDQQQAPPQDSDTVQLSPEVKQMIADEVERQLAAERAAAATPAQTPTPANPNADEAPAALDPNHRVFVVASNLDVTGDDGQECTLTPGDVILRTSNNPDGTKVPVNVVTSKQGDCASNTNTAVEVSDLQEMQNHFREQMDSGMKSLADQQGRGGLPQAPDTSTVGGEVPPPAADTNAQKELQNEQNAADGVETAVKTSAKDPGN